jgi:hypothetical protein
MRRPVAADMALVAWRVVGMSNQWVECCLRRMHHQAWRLTVTFTAETLLSETYGSEADARARAGVLRDRLLQNGWTDLRRLE